jgi:flagellin
MVMSVNTNVMSLNAQRNLLGTQQGLSVSLQRLSSGLRINSAKDDAAGLAIAERMNAQIRGLGVGIRNANDGISLAQTAEGALGSMTESLQRMRELAVQSANATNTSADRASLDAEFQALKSELESTATRTKFNGLAIIGTDAGTQGFQVGANSGDTISVTTVDATTIDNGIGSVTTSANAVTALGTIDTALNTVNSQRASLGAAQSRMETAIRALDTTRENTAAARGRIVDADFAAETANMTRLQILQQAGVAMLAQANAAPQTVLSLLQ